MRPLRQQLLAAVLTACLVRELLLRMVTLPTLPQAALVRAPAAPRSRAGHLSHALRVEARPHEPPPRAQREEPPLDLVEPPAWSRPAPWSRPPPASGMYS